MYDAAGPPRPPPPPSAAAAETAERFSNGMANLLMAVEELRGSVSSAAGTAGTSGKVRTRHVVQWQRDVEHLLQLLDPLARWTDDGVVGGAEFSDLFRHCQLKAIDVAQQAFGKAAKKLQEPSEDDDGGSDEDLLDGGVPINEVRQEGQRAMARLAELNLLMIDNCNHRGIDLASLSYSNLDSVVDAYVKYQRQVLRQRSKPHIAQLVQARQDGIQTTAIAQPIGENGQRVVIHHHDDDGHHNESTAAAAAAAAPVLQQHHAPVLAAILGQAAALIHPLLSWRVNLPPQQPLMNGNIADNNNSTEDSGMIGALHRLCSESVESLDEQAQSLVKTVSEWFFEDRPIEDWMKRSNIDGSGGGRDEYHDYAGHIERHELGILDGLVEELAFSCQIQARYQSLVQSSGLNIQPTIEKELLPEWTWKYAALERFLAMQQWQSALELASPVQIVMGTDIEVPSVVEDAQYLSTRALERAASTLSVQAIGTVAHSISHDVWSTEINGGVQQALNERRGCWVDKSEAETTNNNTGSLLDEAPKSSGFASALLDALDEDLGPGSAAAQQSGSPTKKSPASNKPKSAPSSGNFLSNIVGGGQEKLQQIHRDTEFCAMNGIHAACTACRSLVIFLDSLLLSPDDTDDDVQGGYDTVQGDDPAKKLIQLAREELFRYAEAYQAMLTAHISDNIEASCGSTKETVALRGFCFHDLYAFLDHENYNIDAGTIAKAESDERLDRGLIEPLRSSRFLGQISSKCESDVLRQVGEAVVTTLVDLFLEVLWKTGKQFTDWGSLLLAKQVRLVQAYVSKILSPDGSDVVTPSLFQKWERLSQVLSVLQLEKPSDWLAYSSSLSPDELRSTLQLRVDFSPDAIQAVVSQVSKASGGEKSDAA